MSDTPIADQLAAELGMPWILHDHMEGQLNGWFTDSGPGALGDAAPYGPVGAASTPTILEGDLDEPLQADT